MRVKFPIHVKVDGEYYAPGEAVEVEDAAEAVMYGAEIIEETKPADAPARGRKRKAE